MTIEDRIKRLERRACCSSGSSGYTSILYADFIAAATAGTLTAGTFYLITDATKSTNAGNVPNGIPILVQAVDGNNAFFEAQDMDFPEDSIDYNFNTDIILYRWDTINDASQYADWRHGLGITVADTFTNSHLGHGNTGAVYSIINTTIGNNNSFYTLSFKTTPIEHSTIGDNNTFYAEDGSGSSTISKSLIGHYNDFSSTYDLIIKNSTINSHNQIGIYDHVNGDGIINSMIGSYNTMSNLKGTSDVNKGLIIGSNNVIDFVVATGINTHCYGLIGSYCNISIHAGGVSKCDIGSYSTITLSATGDFDGNTVGNGSLISGHGACTFSSIGNNTSVTSTALIAELTVGNMSTVSGNNLLASCVGNGTTVTNMADMDQASIGNGNSISTGGMHIKSSTIGNDVSISSSNSHIMYSYITDHFSLTNTKTNVLMYYNSNKSELIQYETPANAATITSDVTKDILVVNPAALRATGTINLPDGDLILDGKTFIISAESFGITALTLTAPHATINTTLTTLIAGTQTRFVFRAADTTWYRY